MYFCSFNIRTCFLAAQRTLLAQGCLSRPPGEPAHLATAGRQAGRQGILGEVLADPGGICHPQHTYTDTTQAGRAA